MKIKVHSKHKHKDPIIIDQSQFLPGDSGVVKIIVGRIPSDNQMTVLAHVIRHRNPGPVVLLLGGIHGDELNGVEIVGKVIEEKDGWNFTSGTIIAVPLLNVFGFITFRRDVTEGKDVNRSFPGSSTGSLASRVARTLTKKILPYVDVAMDFHTGGASRYNYPQVRYLKTDPIAKQMGLAFGAPFRIEKALIPASFRKAAHDLGIPAIVFEGGEAQRIDPFVIQVAYRGVCNVLRALGMLDMKADQLHRKDLLIERSTWHRAKNPGLFWSYKVSGAYVEKGEKLGHIKDPFGTKVNYVLCESSGYIIGHNNASVVNIGDPLFHIGMYHEKGGF